MDWLTKGVDIWDIVDHGCVSMWAKDEVVIDEKGFVKDEEQTNNNLWEEC